MNLNYPPSPHWDIRLQQQCSSPGSCPLLARCLAQNHYGSPCGSCNHYSSFNIGLVFMGGGC